MKRSKTCEDCKYADPDGNISGRWYYCEKLCIPIVDPKDFVCEKHKKREDKGNAAE